MIDSREFEIKKVFMFMGENQIPHFKNWVESKQEPVDQKDLVMFKEEQLNDETNSTFRENITIVALAMERHRRKGEEKARRRTKTTGSEKKGGKGKRKPETKRTDNN